MVKGVRDSLWTELSTGIELGAGGGCSGLIGCDRTSSRSSGPADQSGPAN